MVNPLQPPRSPSLTPISPKSEAGALSPPRAFTSLGSLSPLSAPKPLRSGTDTLGLGMGFTPRSSISGSPRPLRPPSRSSLCSSRSPSPPPHNPPKPLAHPTVDDVNWREGDFEILSSDNVRFTVASYHVLSSSAVLRAAATYAAETHKYHLTFSDEEVESALVIRSFLRIITTGKVATTPDGSGTPSVAALRRLILFTKKYECGVALQLVLFKIKELLGAGISVPMYSFILGATADDVETCCVSLQYMEKTWNAANSGRASPDVRIDGTPGTSTIDPNNLPYTLWQWIPTEYMWALSRAWGKHVQDSTRLPDEFRRVLGVIKSMERGERRPSVVLA